ncbi:hypothetical protein F442_12920 [Phytophthora nicotianae P10297]|uniref:Uncharacterized protein n=2 Tax=Phytophthora nicotianae TaxID=4792 RepID=W2Z088_PHYNI|nr:hypothetical protein F444_13127 [Phytophthora nicotianae P1976]ETP39629.1 hypothetical protein F442_12920 [Phytophthora nicotianae P10297]
MCPRQVFESGCTRNPRPRAAMVSKPSELLGGTTMAVSLLATSVWLKSVTVTAPRELTVLY